MTDNPYNASMPEKPLPTDGRNRLLPAAIGLIVVSSLWIALAFGGVVYYVGLINDPDTDFQTRRTFTMSIGWIVISILYCVAIITGAVSMARRGSYMWAVVTSCLAMVPLLGPCYFLGITFGIWSFLLLRQPGVRESFRNP
ncbi:MAG TPA: hypothetical protein P5307_19455 [Pirellulaceae bacterium]|nr:hypothetical protein [Pirellulaceae bacterium]